ncbi:MAG TPA: SRPBCC family protein [Chitinophagaceae bacterium]|nr:SRPBCC family protein [Chitinophagaceae bacterium]
MSKLQARNEAIINAPISSVWAIITDISLLHKINPGVITAVGRMDKQGETRTCEMNNRGRKGTMTEKLIELVPEKKTVWAIEGDSMGMKKMLKDPRFCFYLEKLGDNKTKIINESYYEPANLMVKIMNALMMKRKMREIQEQILSNIKSIAEK